MREFLQINVQDLPLDAMDLDQLSAEMSGLIEICTAVRKRVAEANEFKGGKTLEVVAEVSRGTGIQRANGKRIR
jgi:hypothetical protein